MRIVISIKEKDLRSITPHPEFQTLDKNGPFLRAAEAQKCGTRRSKCLSGVKDTEEKKKRKEIVTKIEKRLKEWGKNPITHPYHFLLFLFGIINGRVAARKWTLYYPVKCSDGTTGLMRLSHHTANSLNFDL